MRPPGTLITHLIGRLADPLLFRAPAPGSRLPLFAGAAARIYRAGRALSTAKAPNKTWSAGGSARSSRISSPSSIRRMRVIAFTPDLRPNLADHSLCLHGAVLLCRQDPARHHDPDRQRLRAGGERPDVLHQLLHLAGGLQIGGRPPEFLRCRDRGRAAAGRRRTAA